MEGADTVPLHQQRLFLNFERRLEGRTKAIENWIEMVEIAQNKRREELKRLAQQPDLMKFHFTKTKTQQNRQLIENYDRRMEIVLNTATIDGMRNNWVQQDLRQMFLRPNPNVRMRA